MSPNYCLRREREARGWSQARLAELVDTEATTVGRWERGISFPYPHFREKLCALFGKSAQELGLLLPETEEQREMLFKTAMGSQASIPPSNRVYDSTTPLPLPLPLIGRESLLMLLQQRLGENDTVSYTALYGLPGAGKTSLATCIAHDLQLLAHFPDGVLWAALGPQANPLAHLNRWGALLGVRSEETIPSKQTEDWARAIRAAIGLRHFLLVIDDAWEDSAALALQVGGPHCSYLLTTRFPQLALLFANEGAISVPELAEHDGLALLERYVPNMKTDELAIAQELVSVVGGLPLALTLIGRHLQMQGYAGLQRRRQATALRLLNAEERLRLTLPHSPLAPFPNLRAETPLSLQSAIAVSVELLPEEVQHVFYALAVFPAKPNSFSEDAALAVCEKSVEILDLLCDTGLLECPEPQRYMLHQTISAYACVHRPDTTSIARMVNYYINYVEQHKQKDEALEREMTNILAALDVAQTQGMQAEQVQGILSITQYFFRRGLYNLVHLRLQDAYQGAKKEQNIPVLVSILRHLGEGAAWQGEHIQAEHYLKEGLFLARAEDDRESVSTFLSLLGFATMQRGNYTQAELYLQEGLALALKAEHFEQCAELLRNLGLVSIQRTDFQQAQRYLQQGFIYARQARGTEQILKVLVNLGMVASYQRDFLQAEKFYAEALTIAQDIGTSNWLNALHNNLGQTARLRGDYAQARHSFQEAISLAKGSGNGHLRCISLLHLTELELEQQDYVQAETYCQEGLLLARQLELREIIVQLLMSQGKTLSAQQKESKAEQVYREALAIAQNLDASQLSATVLYELGKLLEHDKRFDEAAIIYNQLFLISMVQDDVYFAATIQYKQGQIAAIKGEINEAHRLGTASLQIIKQNDEAMATEIAQWLEHLSA